MATLVTRHVHLTLDYWFWGAVDQYIKETKPQSIEELTEHVSEYARTIPKEHVYKTVKEIFCQSWLFFENGGGAFEPMLKSYKRRQ